MTVENVTFTVKEILKGKKHDILYSFLDTVKKVIFYVGLNIMTLDRASQSQFTWIF